MSQHNQFTHYNYFKNKELSLFYIAIAIMTFARSLINIFIPIYLYELGYSIPLIIIFYTIASLANVVFAYPSAKIIEKIGEKHAIIASLPLIILFFIGLLYIESYPILFWILPLLLAARGMLYNISYHLNFVNDSQKSKRGKQVSTIAMIVLLATALAPYFGGLLMQDHIFALIAIATVLMFIGSLPLLASKDKYEIVEFSTKELLKKITDKEQRGSVISYTAYAIESMVSIVVWPIFLITVLKNSSTTGLIYSASLLVSLLIFHFMGKITDKYNKIRLLKIGNIMFVIGWIGRIFASSATTIFFIDSYRNIAEKVLHLPWTAHGYNLASRTNHFTFIVFREIVFNTGRTIILPFFALIFYLNYHPFILSFAAAALFSLGYMFINKK